MTRKDYRLIADVIANLDEMVDRETLEAIAENFADALAQENPRFDRKIFLANTTISDKRYQEIEKIWS